MSPPHTPHTTPSHTSHTTHYTHLLSYTGKQVSSTHYTHHTPHTPHTTHICYQTHTDNNMSFPNSPNLCIAHQLTTRSQGQSAAVSQDTPHSVTTSNRPRYPFTFHHTPGEWWKVNVHRAAIVKRSTGEVINHMFPRNSNVIGTALQNVVGDIT